MGCRKGHDLGMDVHRGQCRWNNTGFRRVVETAEHNIFRNGFSKITQGPDGIYRNKVVGADEQVRQFGIAAKCSVDLLVMVFFDAELLALPVQETESNYYFKLAYDYEKGIRQFSAKLARLGIQVEASDILKKICEATAIVEGQKKPVTNFKELCNDEHLPIIARNKLDNGESVNLWYEQVLPSKSVLGTVIECGDELIDALNGKIVQIGANATVGYGYCTFVKLNDW